MFNILFGAIVLLLTLDSIRAQATKGSCSCATPKIGPVVTSAFTPFKTNGNLSLAVVPKYAQYFKDNGVLDIKVAAYIGEASSMNLCDRIALIQAWVDAATPLGIRIIVQVAAGLPFNDTLILAELCVKLKVKAISVIPETIYIPQTVDEAIADLQLIAKVAVGIPIFYEDLGPLESASAVSIVDIFKSAVAEIPCFVGLFTDINTALNIKAVTSIADKILIISGHESVSAAIQLKLNATGDSITNVFPSLVVDIVAVVLAGNLVLAEQFQAELNLKVSVIIGNGDPMKRMTARSYIPNQRAALELMTGLEIAIPRLPLLPTALEMVKKIASGLKGLGVLLAETAERVLETVN